VQKQIFQVLQNTNYIMETLIIETEGKKLQAILSVLTALNISFIKSNSISIELDKKIEESRIEKAKGQLKIVNPQNIWESIS
jgi:mannitol-specific phosphotransferase system IIBC component